MPEIRFVIEKYDGDIDDVRYQVSPEFSNDKDALRGIIKSYLGRRMENVKKIASINNERGVIYIVYPEERAKPKIHFPKGLFEL